MISVIIPIYNAIEYLSETIQSVLSQTFQDWELILVDDGSTDGSGRLCDEYAQKDSRISVVHIKNGGVSNARNVGLSLAKGEWIEFVDSDDLLVPTTIETLFLHADNNVDLVVCGYETFPLYGKTRYISKTRKIQNVFETKKEFSFLYTACFYNSIWNKLYRKEKIKQGFDKTLSLGEDLLFNLDFMKDCQGIVVIPDILYRYRRNSGSSLTKRARKDGLEIQIRLKEKVDETFNFDAEVCAVTLKNLFHSYVGVTQLLVYEKTIEKAEKLQIISSWLEKMNSYNIKELNCDGFEKRIIKKYTLRKKTRAIYHYFTSKKQIAKILKR